MTGMLVKIVIEQVHSLLQCRKMTAKESYNIIQIVIISHWKIFNRVLDCDCEAHNHAKRTRILATPDNVITS